MNVRIKQFMDHKSISSSELADSIGVQRSNVTHVLQGRNKPGFLFISKLLETYPEINAKWLITGEGDMLTASLSIAPPPKNDLFSEPMPISAPEAPKGKEPVGILAAEPDEKAKVINKEPVTTQLNPELVAVPGKEVERIVVFYSDQTFKQYLPSK